MELCNSSEAADRAIHIDSDKSAFDLPNLNTRKMKIGIRRKKLTTGSSGPP